MLGVEIVALDAVFREVIEFARMIMRFITAFLFEPVGFGVVVATGCIYENVMAFANGKFATYAVMHSGFAKG